MNILLDIIATLYKANDFYDIGKMIVTIVKMTSNQNILGGKIGIYDKEKDEYRIYFNSFNEANHTQEEINVHKPVNVTCRYNEIKFYSRIAAETRKTFIIQNNHSKESLKIHPEQIHLEPQAMLWVPLIYNDEFLGIISLAGKPINCITDELIELFEGIGKITSVKVYELLTSKKLKESEERFRSLYENVSIGLYRTTPEGKILLANPALVEMLGYSSFSELEKISLIDEVFDPEYPRSEFINRITDDGTVKGYEYIWRKKNKERIYVRENAKAIRDDSGNIKYYEGTIEDISEQKKIYQNLIESESNFKSLFNVTPVPTLITEYPSGVIYLANKAFLDITKFRSEDIIGKRGIDLNYFKDESENKQLISSLFSRRDIDNYEIVTIDADRKERYNLISMRVLQMQGKEYSLITIMNITQLKMTEEALKQSEEKYKQIVETTNEGIIVLNRENKITFVNLQIASILGFTPDELTGMDIQELIAEEHIETHIDEVNNRKKGFSSRYERLLKNKNGNKLWFNIASVSLKDKNNEYSGSLAMLFDITQRKESENRLLLMQYSLDHSYDVLNLISKDGSFYFINQAAINQLGYSKEEFSRLKVFDLAENFSYDLWRTHWEEMKKKKFMIIETRHLRKDGTYIPVEISINHIEFEGNEYIFTHTKDITERKFKETFDEKYRELLERSEKLGMFGSWEIDLNTKIVNASKGAYKIYGVPDGKFSLSYIKTFPLPEYRNSLDNALELLISGESKYDVVYKIQRLNDKAILEIHTIAEYLPLNNTIYGIIYDITEQKKAEEIHKLDESRLEALVRINQMDDASPKNITIHTMEEAVRLTQSSVGYIAFVNEDETKMTMYAWSSNAMMNCKIQNKPIEYFVDETGLWGEAIRQRKPIITNDYDTPNLFKKGYPEGHIHIKRHMNIPVFDGHHIVAVAGVGNKLEPYDDSDIRQLNLLMIGMWRIIQRKQAEDTLKQNEMKYRELFDNAPVGYHEMDINGKIARVNSTELLMLGYEKNEFIDHFVWDFIMERDLSKERTLAKLAGKQPAGKSYERTYLRKDGNSIPVLAEDILLKDLDGKIIGMRSTIQDISERKMNELAIHESNIRLEETLTELRETQKQVLQQERLRALGQLASGIAHDINNSLSPILGYADLLLRKKDILKIAEKQLTLIKTASQDIKRTIDRMKEFYRPKTDDEITEHININRIIDSTLELTKHRWKDISESRGIVITINKELQENLPNILGNESEIREALTNLILNACDAMPNGGVLDLQTQLKDNNIILEIIDSGIGMNEETLQRCLEPFYTTKGEKGTGLGLSMVYGIINRHEGKISIESKVHHGTKISLTFPIHRKDKFNIDLEKEEISIPSLKILCIDDDEKILQMLFDMLQSNNHEINLASSGKQGLDKFFSALEDGKPFDLIITDLGMPYMDGTSVAQGIKSVQPDIPIILMTGWGSFLSSEKMPAIDYILKKPVVLDELIKSLKIVLKI
jgi:PAS domain S-box-containing protein